MTTSSMDVTITSADATPKIRQELRSIGTYSHLLYNLVHRDLTVRYKRSVLGFAWTMLNPLLLMLIFVVVFSSIFRFAIKHYEIYFLAAYVAWNFFAQTTIGAMGSLAWNGALMKRVRVPKTIFALASTISGIINLLLSFVPLLLIMYAVGMKVHASILFVPFGVLLLGIFTFGVALLLSAVAVFFTDVREMWTIAITGLMYLTPIVYPLAVVPERYRRIILYNPLFHLLELIRQPIYDGVLPSSDHIWASVIAAAIALTVGWLSFSRLARNFYSYL